MEDAAGLNLCSLFRPIVQVKFLTPDGDEDMAPKPPFRVTLPKVQKRANLKAKPATNKRKGLEAESNDADTVKEVLVEAYVPSDPGPYPQDQPKQNSVRFTPVQVIGCFFHIQSDV